jgi:hypothetical protein
MPFTTKDQLTIEKSPAYFVSRQVPERVHKLNPHMKLLLVVRNPVVRAISGRYFLTFYSTDFYFQTTHNLLHAKREVFCQRAHLKRCPSAIRHEIRQRVANGKFWWISISIRNSILALTESTHPGAQSKSVSITSTCNIGSITFPYRSFCLSTESGW